MSDPANGRAWPRFVHVSVADLTATRDLFEDGLGFRCRTTARLSSGGAPWPWSGARIEGEIAYLEHPVTERSLGLRVLGVGRDQRPQPRDGSWQSGPFGFTLRSHDLRSDLATFVRFGAEPLSDPQVFSEAEVGERLEEVVCRLPDGYHVTLIQRGDPRRGGTPVLTSFSIMARDLDETDRFWRGSGMRFQQITTGVEPRWATLRQVPRGTTLHTGRYRSSTGDVYRAWLPALSPTSLPPEPDVSRPGGMLLGMASTSEAWPETRRRSEVGPLETAMPPWPPGTRVHVAVAPDGVPLEIGPSGVRR